MFQVTNRMLSASYNPAERDIVNAHLQELQERTGTTFTSGKEVIAYLLQREISGDNNARPDNSHFIEQIKQAESKVQQLESLAQTLADSNDRAAHEITELKAALSEASTENAIYQPHVVISDEFSAEINEFREEVKLAADTPTDTVLQTAVQLAMMQSIENDTENEPLAQQGASDAGLLVPYSEEELTLLQLVLENRQTSYSPEDKRHQKTIQQLVHDMTFNRAVLYNWSGEFYTGL